MGQDMSSTRGDCWVGEQRRVQVSSRAKDGVQIATPRHHNPAQAPAQQHDKYAGAALPTSDIFGGAYIPEMMQAPLESAGERVKRIHSTAPPAPDRDVSTPPAATFVGHAAAAATAVPAFPGMTPGSSTPRVHGYTVVPPGGQAGSQTPRRLDDAFSASTHRAQDEGGPAGRPALDPGQDPAPLTPRRSGAPLTPRGATRRGNGLLTPRSQNGLLTPRGRNMRSSGRDRSVTPEKRDSYAATKGGWIQTSVTISDMNIAAWTQQKQDMFIEAVAATAQVGLCDVCVLSLKEKCGRRLLSIATEITFQVRATSGEHAREIVRELKSQALDNMMLQANIRWRGLADTRGDRWQRELEKLLIQDHKRIIRPDTARGVDVESGLMTPRSADINNPLRTPFRNGYSLTSSYQSQFGAEDGDNENDASAADSTAANQGGSKKPGQPAKDGTTRLGDPASGTMLL